MNDQGKLVETDFLVNEPYARQNEVWVVGINERVDSYGNVRGDMSLGRTQGTAYPNARFYQIKITSHKESWSAGASEVNIKRYLSFYYLDQYSTNPVAGNYTSEDSPSDGDGWRIKKVDRGDVGDLLTINWTYISDWPNRYYNFDNGTSIHTDYFYYVIFEYDAWPTGMRTAYIPDAGQSGYTINTNYRSADTYYDTGFIPEASVDGWINNEGLYFSSQY